MSPRGVYDRTVDPNSLVGKLDAMKALARQADKLETKARKLRTQAQAAAMAAGDARDKLGKQMKEIERP